jgi:hypothetical protein
MAFRPSQGQKNTTADYQFVPHHGTSLSVVAFIADGGPATNSSGSHYFLEPGPPIPSAEQRQIICEPISVLVKSIISARISAGAEMQTEIYYFSCTESRDFGAHFGAPKMLGFGRTFFGGFTF